MSSNSRSPLLLSHLVVLCSDANQISWLCNSACRAPTSNITPLANATTGEDIQNFLVIVAAIRTMNGMNHFSSFSAVYRHEVPQRAVNQVRHTEDIDIPHQQ